MSSFIRLVEVLHELQPLNRLNFHKINHNYVTNYQNLMKLKVNLYQCNMAIYMKFRQNVSIRARVPSDRPSVRLEPLLSNP